MKKITKKMLSFIFMIGLFVGVCPVAYANDSFNGVSLSLGPTSQRVTLMPGEEYRGEIYISSPADSTQEANYILYVTPYGVSNDNYDPVFDQKTAYTQMVDWITLDKTEGSVSPNEIEYIGFTIDVPSDAPAGGQYATIMAQDVTGVDDAENSGGLSISNITAIGSIVVADVMGETREEGEILENNIPSFLLSNELTATSLVKNEGNVHADAKFVLQVSPLFNGEEICTNEEEPSTSLVIPETSRYNSESCKLPSVGIFRAKQTVEIFGETSIAERLVFVCPLWLLFIIIFAIVMFIIWLVMKVRAKRKG